MSQQVDWAKEWLGADTQEGDGNVRSKQDNQVAIAVLVELLYSNGDRETFGECFVAMAKWYGQAPPSRFVIGLADALPVILKKFAGTWLTTRQRVDVSSPPALFVIAELQRTAIEAQRTSSSGLSGKRSAAIQTALVDIGRAVDVLSVAPTSPDEINRVSPASPEPTRPSSARPPKKAAPRPQAPRTLQEPGTRRKLDTTPIQPAMYPGLASHGAAFVGIYYATNRARAGDAADRSTHFSGLRATDEQPLSYGISYVSIPASHEEGRIERPSLLRFEFKQDPNKHMIIERVLRCDKDFWVLSAKDRAEEALLFVHGFNVSFDEAMYRAAQIAYDLRFPGLPLCFSWASRGEVLDYAVDEETIRWSVDHLREFLETVATQLGLKRIHIVAHSMGNRALLDVLKDWTGGDKKAELSQVVLAAPDVDAGIFRQLARCFTRAKRVTLYASSADRPLMISRTVHAYPRAGDATPPLVLPDLDTIDATKVGEEMFGLGHSYFAERPKVFSDLFYLIRHALAPSERASLRVVSGAGYFELV